MPMSERLSRGKSSARLPVPSEKVLITTVVLTFLFLHILAAMILQRAAAERTMTPQEQSRPSLYD